MNSKNATTGTPVEPIVSHDGIPLVTWLLECPSGVDLSAYIPIMVNVRRERRLNRPGGHRATED